MENRLAKSYLGNAGKLLDAIKGLSREQLLAKPVPGKWSTQQVVIHLADSDLVLAERMKRIIAEENPPLLAFDESLFATRLFYDDQPADLAAGLFEMNRRLLGAVLSKLTEADFDRTGVHSERGVMTLRQVVTMSDSHLEHHLKFIAEKLEKLLSGADGSRRG